MILNGLLHIQSLCFSSEKWTHTILTRTVILRIKSNDVSNVLSSKTLALVIIKDVLSECHVYMTDYNQASHRPALGLIVSASSTGQTCMLLLYYAFQ